MIVILGRDGMLGKAVTKYCISNDIPHFAANKTMIDITRQNALDGLELSKDDTVINCAGVIDHARPFEMMHVNGIAPHFLARSVEKAGARLIQVSTDCVFSGFSSDSPVRWKPWDTPNPDTIYGVSKRLGELAQNENTVVVRTSFVGPEHGIWRWITEQPEKATIPGWVNAYWSGSTVDEVATQLVEVAVGPRVVIPITHLATADPISKYRALIILCEALRRDIDVSWHSQPFLDRSLEPTLRMRSLEAALK